MRLREVFEETEDKGTIFVFSLSSFRAGLFQIACDKMSTVWAMRMIGSDEGGLTLKTVHSDPRWDGKDMVHDEEGGLVCIEMMGLIRRCGGKRLGIEAVLMIRQ